MSFLDLLTAVQGDFTFPNGDSHVGLVSRLANASLAPLQPEGAILVGPEFLAQQDSYPRIVVDPTGGTIASGSQDVSDLDSDGDAASLSVPTGADVQRFDVHIWGADYATTLVYRDAFFNAMKSCARGAFLLSDYTWTKKTLDAVSGRELVFSVEFRVPIVDVVATFAPAGTTTEAVLTINGPDTNPVETDTIEVP